MLRIPDIWASRNLWFQQLAHSVRATNRVTGPCIVKVPAPSTWPSVLETVPEPLAVACQSNALSWLMYHQKSSEDTIMALSVNLFKPRLGCAWITEKPYMNVLDQHTNIMTAVPESIEVSPVKAKECFCSNDTRNEIGIFMGIAECEGYMMDFGEKIPESVDGLHQVTFRVPDQKKGVTLMVKHQMLPGNVTIGNFQDIWWVCNNKAYIFLPYGWTGCCYMATLKLPYQVLMVQRGTPPEKRELAQFNNLESYHFRISLGEKWGLGLFPWYRVTFLADRIDNIT